MIAPGHDYKKSIKTALADEYLQQALNMCTVRRTATVDKALSELPDVDAIRNAARQIKNYSISHLDELLIQLGEAAEAKGAKVHFASDAEEARQIVTRIGLDGKCRSCVKTKSMTTEEIELTPALIEAGIETWETDLGEFILQLANDRPSHIVTPMIHMPRKKVAQLFKEKLGSRYTEEPPELTKIAREYLREKFRNADMGVVGVNLAVAKTGSLVVLTNEGNGRMVTSRPRVLVAVMGMEKVIPGPDELAVILKSLTRHATGMRLTVYTNFINGVRGTGELDGPEELHIVILDNGRSRILNSEYHELLGCLRCGACLNACPVYRKTGGHAYGSVYPGPIGAAITPLLEDMSPAARHIVEMCTLCGACQKRCPVKMPLPQAIIKQRRDYVNKGHASALYKIAMPLWAWAYSSRFSYELGGLASKLFMKIFGRAGWFKSAPGPAKPWTNSRDVPIPRKSFRQLWNKGKI